MVTWARGDRPQSIPVTAIGGHVSPPLWASLVAQIVKNPSAVQETQSRSLVWEDFPGEGNGYPLQYSCLKNSTGYSGMDYSPWGLKELNMTEKRTYTHIYSLPAAKV